MIKYAIINTKQRGVFMPLLFPTRELAELRASALNKRAQAKEYEVEEWQELTSTRKKSRT